VAGIVVLSITLGVTGTIMKTDVLGVTIQNTNTHFGNTSSEVSAQRSR
jgi:hypothetical protein